MSISNQLNSLTDEDLVSICDTFTSASEYLRSLNVPTKGQYTSIINTKRHSLNLEWKFVSKRKYVDKECLNCTRLFRPMKEAQTTCSIGCANTVYRSGINNGNYNPNKRSYRDICFSVHKKECIICGEDKIVAVHHYDEDHANDNVGNLVPLCPTHHQYMHSKYKHLISKQVDAWICNNI